MALAANFATVNYLLINALVPGAFEEVIPGVKVRSCTPSATTTHAKNCWRMATVDLLAKAGCIGCDYLCRSIFCQFCPVTFPVVVGPSGSKLKHGFGIGNRPPRPGDFQPLLDHVSVSALHFPGTNRQSRRPGSFVIHVVLPFVHVLVGSPHGWGLLSQRFKMGLQGFEHLLNFVFQQQPLLFMQPLFLALRRDHFRRLPKVLADMVKIQRELCFLLVGAELFLESIEYNRTRSFPVPALAELRWSFMELFKKVCDMQHTDVTGAGFTQAGSNLQDTPWIRRHDNVGACSENVLHFSVLKALGHFWLGEIVTSGAATTDVGLRQFDEFLPGDVANQIAWLFGNSLRVREVAGVMISDSH